MRAIAFSTGFEAAMIDPQKYPDVLYCHTDLHDSEVEFELPTGLGEGTGLIENGSALSRL